MPKIDSQNTGYQKLPGTTSSFSHNICSSCGCDDICFQSLCWYGCAQCLWAENQVQLGFELESSKPCWNISCLTLIYPMFFNIMGFSPLGIASQCMGGVKAGQARTRFRKEYNLSPDPCCACPCCAKCCFAGDKEKQADCCQWIWCPVCALCQETREIKMLKENGTLPAPFHPPFEQVMTGFDDDDVANVLYVEPIN